MSIPNLSTASRCPYVGGYAASQQRLGAKRVEGPHARALGVTGDFSLMAGSASPGPALFFSELMAIQSTSRPGSGALSFNAQGAIRRPGRLSPGD